MGFSLKICSGFFPFLFCDTHRVIRYDMETKQVLSGYHGTHKNEMGDVFGRQLFHFLKCPLANFRGKKHIRSKMPSD